LPLRAKEQSVRQALARSGPVAIAFSGGADSSLLLWLALDTLGPDQVLVLTARSCLLPPRDLERAAGWPARHGLAGVRYVFVDIEPLAWDEFTRNPADRCYLCKTRVYRLFLEQARRQGVTLLIDGTNGDDLRSDRPGLRAIGELGIGTPLAAAGLSKPEIRALSRELGLDTWDAPSASCLATRIPEGLAITPERLARIDILESHLQRIGFAGCRVRLDRWYEDRVYVQVQEKNLPRLAGGQERTALLDFFNDSGITKVFLDLQGR
jgi:uncharacterized protein